MPEIYSSALIGFNSLPDEGFVRLPVVAALWTCSRGTVWRWVKEGRIPAPYKLSPRTTAWRAGELRAALAKIERD
ncbi:helix-turn-helix transcriptional regulator [Methylobacillus methanolivorans]|uniref:Helix-turn-helix transcriptional regulator n=1 Tax=Methylobacillus methanolivorans TaxID=1848927 RepID=A0ABW8GPJ0_9PROT